MNKIFAAAIVVFAAVVTGLSQVQPDNRRIIEVSGSAEMLVIPNEFTFRITILERIEKKEKLTIEQQEEQLRAELTKIGIDPGKDLSIYDLSANYIPRKRIRDTLGSKDYRLIVRDIKKIGPLTELIDALNIAKLDLISTDNSEMTRYRREVKIEAIKAAREKAQYLLEAIGQSVGKAVYIDETETGSIRTGSIGTGSNTFVVDGQEVSNFRSRGLNSSSTQGRADDDPLTFSATKIRFVINAKFEIE